MSEAPYTARTLARRWQCTPMTIYNLKARGMLCGFKLGGKLWRIGAEEVARIEQTTALGDSKEDGLSFGMKAGAGDDGVLSQRMRLKREQHSATLPENVTRLHGQQGE